MKIIHSFWSKPAFHNNQDYHNARKFGGWPSFKYFLISNCFSCLTSKRHHKEIDLFTDTKGYDLFINLLNLPYDHVSLALDELQDEDHRLWILGKVKAIKAQTKPFIHLDNDVYLWRTLTNNQVSPFLIAQSILPMPEIYKQTLNEVVENFSYVPPCLQEKPNANTTIANVGIIGGNDIDFFQEFCEVSSQLLEKNRDHVSKINIGSFNQIMEEYLFTCLAREKRYDIQYLIDASADEKPMESVLRFNLVPLIDKYIHLIGIAKQVPEACEQLELRFEYEFPVYYKKVSEIIKETYPALADTNSGKLNSRKVKLVKAIQKLYECDVAEILKMNVQLIEEAEIVEKNDAITSEVTYILHLKDANTALTTPKELIGTDHFLLYFSTPISINDLLEELKLENGSMDLPEFERSKFKLLDIVLEKIIIDGVLEFI